MQPYFLAIEGGGTKTRIILAQTDGAIVAQEIGGSASKLYLNKTTYAPVLHNMLARIQSHLLSLNGYIQAVGMAAPMDVELIQQEVELHFGTVPFHQFSEGGIALACHALNWGIVVVAGTGASAWAQSRQGGTSSCGGFGPQFGDEGSGYWIGRSAITAALLAYDKRGPETVLGDHICSAFQLDKLWDIYQLTDHSGHVSGPRIASLAPMVFESARSGDSVARQICCDAGTALAKLAINMACKMQFDNTLIPLIPAGGVFHGGSLVLDSFQDTLNQSPFQFNPLSPITEPASGILALLQKTTIDTTQEPIIRKN